MPQHLLSLLQHHGGAIIRSVSSRQSQRLPNGPEHQRQQSQDFPRLAKTDQDWPRLAQGTALRNPQDLCEFPLYHFILYSSLLAMPSPAVQVSGKFSPASFEFESVVTRES